MPEDLYELLDRTKFFAIELVFIGLLFYFIEKRKPAEEKSGIFKPGFKEEIGLALLNVSLFSPISYAIVSAALLYGLAPLIPYQIFDTQLSSMPLSLQVLFACFLMDFSVYWRHRFTHHFMWPFHAVHHAAKNIGWTTALRLHPVDIFIATAFDITMLHIFGFSAPGIILAVFVMKGFNYFTHANINLQFNKPMRYIFASPNFHRWHHATAKSAHNKNFCVIFSLLDVMFGTYHHPEELPEDYGLEPADQKEYPNGLIGWLTYPFQRIWRGFKNTSKK